MSLFLVRCRESPVLPLSLLCLLLSYWSLLGLSLFCSSQPSSLISRLSAAFEALDSSHSSHSYHHSNSPRGSV